MAQLCLSIASDDLVVLRLLEEQLMLLRSALVSESDLRLWLGPRVSENSLSIHTKNMLTCSPYGPGSLISSEAIIYSSLVH